MKFILIKHPMIFIICCIVLLTGCTTFHITNIDSKAVVEDLRADSTIEEVVSVDKMRIGPNNEYGDADSWQQGLSESLKSAGGFKYVASPHFDDADVDIVVRGEVSGEFQNRGFLNFITWWPGPFLFMHNWRGSRFLFDAQADVELFDNRLNTVVGKYHAKTSHELVHRSNNPGPMFAALIVVPGVIKGIMTSWPREKYRRQMYEVAYPDLWKQISQDIAKDQANRHAKRVELLRPKCENRVDQPPVIGMKWEEFISCQTRHFTLLGQQQTDAGLAYIYENLGKSIRIQVIDGIIARWLTPKKRAGL